MMTKLKKLVNKIKSLVTGLNLDALKDVKTSGQELGKKLKDVIDVKKDDKKKEKQEEKKD